MRKVGKIVIVLVLAAAVAVVIVMKTAAPACPDAQSASQPSAARRPNSQRTSQPSTTLPRLVDLGRKICIPCKMMAPILKELKAEYAGRLEVEFIDVGEHPEAKELYGIDLIPTQIFIDAGGTELHRHAGFMSKEDILATWRELGVLLGKAP